MEPMQKLNEKITTELMLQKPEWEMVVTKYEDADYSVFREVGMKEKQTLWIHVHQSGYTSVFINESQYLKTVTYLHQLEAIMSILQE